MVASKHPPLLALQVGGLVGWSREMGAEYANAFNQENSPHCNIQAGGWAFMVLKLTQSKFYNSILPQSRSSRSCWTGRPSAPEHL